jgi:uncharacterized protein (DUF1330 family)
LLLLNSSAAILAQPIALASRFDDRFAQGGTWPTHGEPDMPSLTRLHVFVLTLIGAGILTAAVSVHSFAQSQNRPAFVIVERLTTTGPESLQEQYGKVSRDIVAKFGGRYLARSQHNALLEGEGSVPCCMAILSFPSVEAAKNWFDSPENQEAAKIRRSGATFRIVSLEGLPPQ